MQPDIDREQADRTRARRQRAAQIQRRRLVFLACVLVVVIVIVIVAAKSCGGDDGAGTGTSTTESTGGSTTGSTTPTSGSTTFTAELTGADSVPAVETEAAAKLTLDYDSEAKEMTFTLDVTSKISNPQVATICQGLPGEYGTTVCTIFGGPAKEGDFDGLLTEGTIIDSDLVGTLEGKTVADLVALIESGEAYVSIGNESHPVDAIRGPIE